MGAGMAFTGSAAALGSTNITNSDTVVLGAFDQSITEEDNFIIDESSVNEFGSSGSGEITVPDPVTFNQSASNPTVLQTSDGSISNARFTDSRTLEFDYSGLNTSQKTNIQFGALSLDVPESAGTTIAVDVRVGTATATKDVTTNQPTLSVSGGNNANPSGNTGNQQVGAAATSDVFSVEVATATEDGQIGAGTNVVLFANESNGITFDTSLSASSDASDLTYSNGANGNLDTVNASISSSGDRLTIPVTNDFSSGESVIVEGLQVNATADASDSQLSADTTPANGLSSVSGLSAAGRIDVVKPTVSVTDNNDAVVGLNGTGDITVDISSSSAGDIASGTNVTITLNNSNVTFDTTQGLDPTTGGSNNDLITANDDLITENSITFEAEADSDGDETVQLSNVAFNISNQAADEEDVQVSAETQGSASGPLITSSDGSTFLTLQRPSYSYSGDTVDVDNDGEDQNVLSDITVDSVIGGDIADSTNVTVSIAGGSGVTFDQSDSNTLATSFNNSGGDSASAVNPAVINEQNVTVEVTGIDNSDEDVTFENVGVNVTADATNTTLAVTTNTSDSEVTTDLSNQIIVNKVSASQIQANANVSGGNNFGGFGSDETPDSTADQPAVTETVTGAVNVQNGVGDFGGADVNLSVVSTPEGSSGASLNTSTITTASDGEAQFNFTAGDTTGDYVVNTTIAGTSTGVNITYTAQSGSVADVSVAPVEDAIAGQTGDLGNAALYVNLTDAQGNLVSSQKDVELSVDSADASASADDDLDSTGQASNDGSTTILSGSTLTIDADDGSSVVSLTDSTVEDVTVTADFSGNSDSGTVTFYNNVGAIDVTLNNSQVTSGERATVSATIQDSNGQTITVPDAVVTIDDNSGSNTSFESPSVTDNQVTANTNGSGVAQAVVEADATGSSTIDATFNLKKGSADLTINQASPDFAVSNVAADNSTVTVGENVTVTADIENVGTASDTQTVDFRLDTDQNGTLESDEELDNTSVQLDAGGNQTVTFENISTDALSAGDYTHGVFSANDSDTTTLTVEPQAGTPANFAVSNVSPDGQNVTAGESIDVSATVENIGGQSGEQTLSFRVDTDENGTLENDEELDNTTLSLNASENQTVQFTNIDTSALSANTTYTHGVFSDNSSATANITVEEDSTAISALIQIDLTADRDVQTAKIPLFSETPKSASYTLLPHHVYNYTRIHNGELR